ncbi:DAK2 domain-containing protein [Brevibacterium ravenspurgense]|uniref:DAK2 domain-containing protein n=1 Tax=Brevibacterium ravenspurgense TaxID=479117 RepID=UPI001EF3677A|nr:DAK2 domain-containing protein [Brevibacterium ravenspurgense]MCG7300588.1 DAK2 domain-containing protein [Brevibacterium ravenspurgense]
MVNDNSMRWGGRLAARWAQQAVERLRRQRGSIDSINVFPVADGDTGSNMYATVKSAYRAVEAIDGPATLPRVVEAMAAGALRGARGNSGLILAVALRGVADELGEAALAEGDLTPDRFASAIELAAHRAQTAIAEPTHGTMLTVLHAMAETARTQADEGAGLLQQIEAVRACSIEALRDTTGQLDVLGQAQVVDAGASGIVEIFDLLYLTVTGGAVGETPSPIAGLTSVVPKLTGDGVTCGGAGGAGAAGAGAAGAGAATGADTLELVFTLSDSKDRTRPLKRILAKADARSVVISWPMVHVHVTSEAHALRVLRDVEQYGLAQLRTEDLVNGANHGPLRAAAAASTAPLMLRAALTGAIAIRLDRGEQAGSLHDVLSDGTTTVLVADSPEGQASINAAAADGVYAIPTGSPISMVSALAVFDPHADADDVTEDMADAASLDIRRLCFAGQSAAGPLVYTKTDVLVLSEGRILFIEHTPEAAIVEAISRLAVDGDPELITISYGQQATPEMRKAIEAAVRRAYPEAEAEIFDADLSGVCADVGVE